jgi:hypothetical protein
MDAQQAVTAAMAQVEALRGDLTREQARHRAHAELLARPARVAAYGPAAQTALLNAERLARGGAVQVAAPAGVDAVPWAALVHLGSPNATGPLCLVDGGDPAQQPLELWTSDESPARAARGGTVVVLDALLLPEGTQRWLGSSADVGLVVVVPSPMPAGAGFEPHLRGRIGDRTLVLPPLADRAEDLRALALHKLGRIGMRLRGKPLGISMHAQDLLNEHDWPGNDVELEAVLVRAARACHGDVVEAADVTLALGTLGGPRSSRRAAR